MTNYLENPIAKINILYEDSDFLVINKPANLLVHAAGAGESETVSSWLVEKYPDIKNYDWPYPGREGIVHRLDRDTTGVLILAKNPKILEQLQAQFKDHKIEKHYWLISSGTPKKTKGKIESFISRNPKDRIKRSTDIMNFGLTPDARLSLTEYRVLKVSESVEPSALIEAKLLTGRTHQLRVQFKSIGLPILGDPDYTTKPLKRLNNKLGINRQMLHAKRIHFTHPTTGDPVDVSAELPTDFKNSLKTLGYEEMV